MENLKNEEMVNANRDSDTNMFYGMLILTAGGLILYKLGKSVGRKEANTQTMVYMKGALAAMEVTDKSKSE